MPCDVVMRCELCTGACLSIKVECGGAYVQGSRDHGVAAGGCTEGWPGLACDFVRFVIVGVGIAVMSSG